MRIRALAVAVAVCGAPLLAQEARPANPIDPRSVAALADSLFPPEMARRHIPGLVFVLVEGGRVAFTRGFGAAQLEPMRPVDPDRTVFRIASVSKIVTATAALQLVEEGRLDLTRDVNVYLDHFQLAPFRGHAVTLHDLLTHTAGFDERLIGVAARDASEVEPLSAYLARSMPPRFIEPGRVISYSNHGMALVGLLVEEVSGVPFHDYIRERILEPLGMRRSGFLHGSDAPADLALAYEFAGGHHRVLSREHLHVGPAGAFATTATDMARFLIAHLQNGAYDGRRILREETSRRMHARQYSQHLGTSGWAYGFYEHSRGGPGALMHDGGGAGYRALVYLLPDRNLGFFLAYNLADRDADGELLDVFRERFLRTFVPSSDEPAVGPAGRDSTIRLAGDYRYVRQARTTMEKVISVINVVRIDEDASGRLTITERSKPPVALTQMGPLLFRRSDDRGRVAFEGLDSGTAARVIVDRGFPAVYDRIPLLATLRAQIAIVLSMALVFLYAAVRRPRSVAGVASALNIVFLVGFPWAFLSEAAGGFPEFVYGVPKVAMVLLLIPLLTGVLAIAASAAALRLWRDRRSRLAARVEHSFIAATLLAFVALAAYWRLLGIQV